MSTNDNTNNSLDQNEPKTNREVNITRQDSLQGQDIHDPERDQDKLKSETFIIDLPDVSDIPGQENIVVPSIG